VIPLDDDETEICLPLEGIVWRVSDGLGGQGEQVGGDGRYRVAHDVSCQPHPEGSHADSDDVWDGSGGRDGEVQGSREAQQQKERNRRGEPEGDAGPPGRQSVDGGL
jgi:hypothetical protein